MNAYPHDDDEALNAFDEADDGASAACPFCGKRADSEPSCPHLAVCAEDDFLEEEVVSFARAKEIWAELSEELPEESATSLCFFEETFLDLCDRNSFTLKVPWDGNFPGQSGFITYIWARHPDKLAAKLQARFRKELARVRKDKMK